MQIHKNILLFFLMVSALTAISMPPKRSSQPPLLKPYDIRQYIDETQVMKNSRPTPRKNQQQSYQSRGLLERFIRFLQNLK